MSRTNDQTSSAYSSTGTLWVWLRAPASPVASEDIGQVSVCWSFVGEGLPAPGEQGEEPQGDNNPVEVYEGVLKDIEELDQDSFCRVVLVLNHQDISLNRVQLAKKQLRHAQRILPFLLEETSLLAPVDQFHVISPLDTNDEYDVASIAHSLVQSLVAFCKDNRLPLECIYSEGQLLSVDAPCHLVFDERVLCASETNQLVLLPGSLSDEQLCLGVSAPLGDKEYLSIPSLFARFIRASQSPQAMNLMGNLYKPVKRAGANTELQQYLPLIKQMAKPALWVSGLLLLVVIIQDFVYQSRAEIAFEKASARYEQLFPGARATAKLRDQFKSRLRGVSISASGGFSSLMETVGESLGPVLQSATNKLTDLRYDETSGELLLSVQVADYEQLEKIKRNMAERGHKVTVVTAQTIEKGVRARLKLSV